jgi:hypothetical protein
MSTAVPKAEQRPAKSFTSLQWWIRDEDGKVVLAQTPNAAITVWLVAAVVTQTGLLDDDQRASVTMLGRGALVAWSLDELIRGASPARRLLGGLVLAGIGALALR